MDKIKAIFANKKTRMICICALVVILLIVFLVVFVSNGYKRQIKALAKAGKNEDKIEKFVKNKMDLRALYALGKAEYDSDKRKIDEDSFKDEYKDASKDDYASDEVIESAASVYSEMFEEDDDQKWVIKKIGDLKKTTKDDTRFNVKGMKRCKVTLENKKADDDAKSSEKKVDCKAYFYKGKLVALVPDFSSYGLDDLY